MDGFRGPRRFRRIHRARGGTYARAGNPVYVLPGRAVSDLTYAAENAVKAVVNIEAIQQVEMPQRRGYDPFLEFFGIPPGLRPRRRRSAVPRAAGRRFGRDYFGGRLYRDEQPRRGRGFETQGEAQRRASFDAKLIGKDSATDLALLKVEANGAAYAWLSVVRCSCVWANGCWRRFAVRLASTTRPAS